MKTIEVILHTEEGGDSQPMKIGENATIDELLNAIRETGMDVGDFEDQITILIGDKEVVCKKDHRLHDCGIKHGHKLHFPDRVVTIYVNTRPKKWPKKEISFKEVVELAFGSYNDHPDIVYTVTYSKGHSSNREGALVKGKSVKVKEGMIFNVTQTNKS